MKNLLVIGGSGFLGSAVVRELARRPASADFCYTLPTRREAGAKHLSVLPTARVVEADVHDPATLARLMAGQDAVISLVGILKPLAGQKPVVTKAKKAIAGFKIREGQAIGCMVTLRGVQMYEFLDRFVTVALPRVRDFRGISARAFDGRGNYNVGVKEQIIFPEIEYDKVDAVRGLNISITTTAKTDEECKALLAGFRFPFKN